LASRLAMTEHFLCDALCEYASVGHATQNFYLIFQVLGRSQTGFPRFQ
jgi:hypothetical protein